MGKYTMSTGKEFGPLPEDKYQVEIYAAEPFMGTKFNSVEEQERLKITFVILDEDKKMLEDGVEVPVRGRRLWSRTSTVFSPVGSKKATNLTKLVSAVFGHELEQAEVDTFEESDLLGKQLCVMVDAKAGTDGTVWNNVLSFSKATKQLPKYDDSEFASNRKEAVRKSSPAIVDSGDSFVKEMEAAAAEAALKESKKVKA